MSASDVPASFDSSIEMAKSLCTYINDPAEVRRRVLMEFSTCPGHKFIKEMRRKHLSVVDYGAYSHVPDWTPEKDMEAANLRFLNALRRERMTPIRGRLA